MSNKKEDILKNEIFKKVKQYYTLVHKPKKFIPGKSYIPYAGRVFDEKELINLVDSSLEFWLTTGRFANKFEKDLAKFLGVKHCILTNSGSSANLLAFMALTSPKLEDRRIKKGDEVITVAAGFPTTVAPILQYGAIPVFVDITLPTYNIDCNQLENALSDKTKAIMLAHTLGNPFDIDKVKIFCNKYNLWLIEDNCDALGSKYSYKGEWRYTGTIGDLGTSSFYPPHHLSCSRKTVIPYLDENGEWKTDEIDKIYKKYADDSEKIKVLSFDRNYHVKWSTPSLILRHRLGHKKMVKIITQHGREVEVTDDHSVFILNQSTAKIIPICARDIRKDDYLVTTNSIPCESKIEYLDILDYFIKKNAFVSGFHQSNLKYVESSDFRWQYKSRNSLPIRFLKKYDLAKDDLRMGISQSRKIPARIPVDEGLCRLIGYFLAEGSYQNGLVFSFHKNEKDLIEDVVGISRRLFGIVPSISKVGDRAVNVEIQSKNVEVIFREAFKITSGAKAKRIPWFIYHCDKKRIFSFIYGYTKGDGSLRKRSDNTNHIDVTSVSKALLNDFQYLLSRVGISASFYRRNRAKVKIFKSVRTHSSENYTLSISGYIYKDKSLVRENIKNKNDYSTQIPLLSIFRKYISIGKNQQTISRERLKKYLSANKELYSLVTGELSFLKVREVRTISCRKNEWVYDISVPGKENFYGGFLGLFLHNTMGEGGAVYTNDLQLKRIVESFRDWGRDCWCASGHDNTCKKRFSQQFGELPYGYDHKYVYSHFGYNLKVTDMQAAIGCGQLEKLPAFIEARKKNWKLLRDGLSDLEDKFILPERTPNSDPSWFGFLLTVREDAGFTRDEIVGYLESEGIQTRMLFAGNLIKHPCFDEMRKSSEGFRIVGELSNTDRIMRDSFWIGVYPGISDGMIGYMVEKARRFVKSKGQRA